MESWSYISDGKGLVSSCVADSPSSSISRAGFVNWVLSDQQQQDTGPSFEELVLIRQQQQQQIVPNPMIGAFSEDSNSIVESGSRDSSLIDLKLGRFKDDGSKFLQRHPILCSSELSVPAKRHRVGSMNSAAAYCQVYGCNKDLSSSKDYHKRHKVCEIHSKTATVIVNGIQQRFCQQCSRFHLLAEFDDGKRSCRKRLAGHNERRRKPQGGAHSGRSGKLPQPVKGNKPQGSIFAPTSFICPGILPEVKAESRAVYGPFSGTPIANAQSRTPIPPYTFEKPPPFFQASSSLLGPAGFSAFSTEISDPGCALSLLSSPSRNSSTHSSGFPMAQALIGMAEPLSHQWDRTEQILRGKEDGPTISLSQLSSRLQRVESQRQSLETKHEHGGFCCPRIA